MRALHFDGSTVQFKRACPEPQLAGGAGGEALIKIHAAGVCQTDYEIARGYMGFQGILGHEFVGTVVQLNTSAPAAESDWLGKRVCGEINCVCGSCEMCQRGLSTHCFRRTVIGILNHDGAFADLLRIPVRNLHAVPDHVTDDEAVFTEPLAAAFQVLRQVPIEKRTRATVLGDGRLGQLVAQVLARTGCTLTLVGRHPEKLALAERIINTGNLRIILDSELTPRRDQDVVVECTGRAEGLQRALAIVRPRGTVVLKTTVEKQKPMNLAPVVIDEITILGSRCGPFGDALAALARHEVNVLPLISRRVKLEDAAELFAPNRKPDGLKTLLTF